MLHTKPVILISLFSLSIVALPTLSSPAKAQDPGRILGPLTSPLRSIMRGVPRPRAGVPRTQRPRAVNTRPSAPRDTAAIERPRADPRARAALGAPAFWPNAAPSAYEDMLGYALWPRAYGSRFWSHGPGDIVQAMMAPAAAFAAVSPAERRRTGTRIVSAARADDQTGSLAADESTCIGLAKDHALRPLNRVPETIDLDAAQRGKFDELRAAVTAAVEREQAACRKDTPASPPERLRAMIDGLWSMRYAEFGIRTSLQAFHDSLTEPQKAALNGEPQTVGSSGAAAEDSPADLCSARNSAGPNLFAPIERSLRPTQEQQKSLKMLHGASMEMAHFLMTTCPAETPATPMARLDAAGDRVMALLHAAMNIEPLFNDFYFRLSDRQRARLNAALR